MNTSYSIKAKILITERQQLAFATILIISFICLLLLNPKKLFEVLSVFFDLKNLIENIIGILLFIWFQLLSTRIHEYSHHYAGKLKNINSEVKLKAKICIPHGKHSRNNFIIMTIGPILVETCIFLIIFFTNTIFAYIYLLLCLLGWQKDISLILQFAKTSKNSYFRFVESNGEFKLET